MTAYPNPTRAQMDRALDLHGNDVARASQYLYTWLGASHPAVRAHITRRLIAHREAPHDTLDY